MGLSRGRPPTKVICTGHSLGAGIAPICGLWASLQWVEADVRVVTFGSPAVGNQAWVDVRSQLCFGACQICEHPYAAAQAHNCPCTHMCVDKPPCLQPVCLLDPWLHCHVLASNGSSSAWVQVLRLGLWHVD